MSYCLPPADVSWDTSATPRSNQHDDIYWSLDDGLAEKQHVFIDGSDLPARFARITTGGHFTVAEIGFGFGLNFLLTARAWRKHNRGGVLHYVAFERSPATKDDLARCYRALFPGDDTATALLDAWPLPSPGWHTRWVTRDVCLVLGLGDAGHLVEDFEGRADAWFLDGFSPSRNPDAWQAELMATLRDRSWSGATVATYSVAGAVRSALTNAGCRLEKRPGHGRKAEMLTGRFPGQWGPRITRTQHVGIVGAGLAGLNCARALRRRGIEVTILESGDSPLTGASGAPGLAVYPQLSARPEWPALTSLAAFGFARHHDPAFRPMGRCHLAESEAEIERFQAIAAQLPEDFANWLDAEAVSARLGVRSHLPGLWFEQAGATGGGAVYEDPESPVRLQTSVREIIGTSIVTDDGPLEFDAVILAGGHRSGELMAGVELEAVRGQSVIGTLSMPLRHIAGGPVSLVPLDDSGQQVVVGGTYDKNDTSVEPRSADTARLRERLEAAFEVNFEPGPAWVGVRATTRDRQPIAGPLPDWSSLEVWCESGEGDAFTGWMPNGYLCTGLGSHGATTAPLLGEHIARLVLDEPGCLGSAWAGRIGPARFRIRDAGRRRDIRFSRGR